MLIDSSGRVWNYKLPENWHFADSNGNISDKDMKENLLKSELTSTIVNRVTLLKYFSKLNIASHGKLTGPTTEVNDIGSISYSGFICDFKEKQYKTVLITQLGDFRIENKSKAASEIFNWLKSIDTANTN